MDVFNLREELIQDYSSYTGSFVDIRDERIRGRVEEALKQGWLWPEPLIQLNPSFESGGSIDELVAIGRLSPNCSKIFKRDKLPDGSGGKPLVLHRHQTDALAAAAEGANYVLTTGTGSGKSLAYILPIVDMVLREGSGRGIRAIVIYPMNALANSQLEELRKFIQPGYTKPLVSFGRYTGQESEEEKAALRENPPDILLTNFVMLEYVMTRPFDAAIVRAAMGLRFLVLDELHTYRGRQGADVAMLVRRVRERLGAPNIQCVGTSATMAGGGTTIERQVAVSRVASLLFGASVKPEHVIGETLRRATPSFDGSNPTSIESLIQRIAKPAAIPETHSAFAAEPFASWLETAFGLQTEESTGRLIRRKPRAIGGGDGAAAELSALTGATAEACAAAIRHGLLLGFKILNPANGFPTFAFRLHQFLSPGDQVYTGLESEASRYVTVRGQSVVPGEPEKILLPLVFCRECGQEYYAARRIADDDGERLVPVDEVSPHGRLVARAPRDTLTTDDGVAGYVYISHTDPWPLAESQVFDRVPADWVEEFKGQPRIRRDRRDYLPTRIRVAPDGRIGVDGIEASFVAAPFRFCLACRVSYSIRSRSDYGKVATLGSEGRSTATTVLAMTAVRNLQKDESLRKTARKLLSFTDNRQDASLQAGHFNDFVEVSLVRAALSKALVQAGSNGLRHDNIALGVFEALSLPFELYALNPAAKYAGREETHQALRDVLMYRVYRDLERGWRVTAPNLEQCALLDIDYLSIKELCHDTASWSDSHPLLLAADPEFRERVARVLLDHLRRKLCIRVDYLNRLHQETLKQRSSQKLKSPWAIDESERLQESQVAFPRGSSDDNDPGGRLFLSARSALGFYLRNRPELQFNGDRLSMPETEELIAALFRTLSLADLVVEVVPATSKGRGSGYQIPAAALIWKAGDGRRAKADPLHTPDAPEEGLRTNPYFQTHYGARALSTKGFEAREHTAQVPYEEREKREQRFREGTLPVLFCSPTMELGVDISDLNVVNLRNVPPSPANYAQRSGRAGRSGQPALVFSYCARGNHHDQYFFKHPDLMVAGVVEPPRLDLANQDLVRAHMHAIWLAETEQDLGKTLADVIDINPEKKDLKLKEEVRAGLRKPGALEAAIARAHRVIASVGDVITKADWYSKDWVEKTLAAVEMRFDESCDRWRGLYRAASATQEVQNRVAVDHTRTDAEKNHAKRLRAEAESQLALLTRADRAFQSDFYTYRYFASEGFLPGYNFPRLPLSAFIPGRTGIRGEDNDFLSRPRFLAITEFGPRAIVYHEGSRYIINKVILPVRDEGTLVLTTAKQCSVCGYLHPEQPSGIADVCENCGTGLQSPLRDLFRLENVATKRKDRISSDEEERLRLGYEVITGVRFADHGHGPSRQMSQVVAGESKISEFVYGDAATLWRINLGWRRRKERNRYGFTLDTERGYWARNDDAEEDADADPMSTQKRRVIPYVEDRRNALVVTPTAALDASVMASLQAALKSALQVVFQLEDSEIAAEPLPSSENRRSILFYESAEGGAGILRQWLRDSQVFLRVAGEALLLCHFDPVSGEDLGHAVGQSERCEKACYDCLMTYGNQMDHPLLDRHLIKNELLALSTATVNASPSPRSRTQHYNWLKSQCDSRLEVRWLEWLEQRNGRFPDRAQIKIEVGHTRPDFVYDEAFAAIYVDGPVHEYPERVLRDRAQMVALEDAGWTVIRFAHDADWDAVLKNYPSIFGKIVEPQDS